MVSINGVAVKSSSELTREVAKARPGDALKLDVIRDGRHRNIEIRSGTRPSERELAANDNSGGRAGPGGSSSPQVQRPSVLGLALAPVDDALRRKLTLPADLKGVAVDSVEQSSDAAQRGFRPGDVIVRAGDRQVASAADFAAVVDAAKKAGRTSVLVGVYRAGRTTFVPLKVSG